MGDMQPPITLGSDADWSATARGAGTGTTSQGSAGAWYQSARWVLFPLPGQKVLLAKHNSISMEKKAW